MVRATLGTTFLAGSCWALSSRTERERPEDGSCGVEGAHACWRQQRRGRESLCEPRAARFVLRTPRYAGGGAGGHGVFRLREGIREANPFTPLKMTRFKRATKRSAGLRPGLDR